MISYIRGEAGVTLVSVMLILLLMMVLGTGLLTSALMENKLVHNLEDQKQVFYLAQAGIEYARYKIQEDITWRINDYSKNLGNGQFTLTVVDAGENALVLRSIGSVDQNQKTLEVGAQYTLAGGDGTVLDDFTAASGGIIDISNNVTVDGQIIANDEVTIGSQTNLGEISENSDTLTIPTVDWDQLLDDALLSDQYLEDWDSSKFQDYVVNYIDNDVDISKKTSEKKSSSSEISLEGIIAINGSLSISNNTEINKDVDESFEGLMIFVNGDVELSNNGIINAAIYATGTITIHNNVVVMGGVYSTTKIVLRNNSTVTFSDHLDQPIIKDDYFIGGSGNEEEITLIFTYWRES
ncbi:MAG: hypothetical protein KAX49_00110 [Halanaerobiales bacterium]|nr:hypothetical protein [Halanaerobiales bacterium]